MTAAESISLKILSAHFLAFVVESRENNVALQTTIRDTRDEMRDDVLQKFELVMGRVEKIEHNCETRKISGEAAEAKRVLAYDAKIAAESLKTVAAATAPTEGRRAVKWFGQVSWRALTIAALLMGAVLYLITILERVHIM